jgi:histidine triad (HIT) family protein
MTDAENRPYVKCPFCERIAEGRYDGGFTLPGSVAVFEPLNPVTRGHLLLVPFEHVRDAAEAPHVTARVMEHAARLLHNFSSPAEPHPYQANVITSIGPAATQTVFHLHVHLVPRREGDGLALPWTGQQYIVQTQPNPRGGTIGATDGR